MADGARNPPFEVAMMELLQLEGEATSLKKQAAKASRALEKKINDLRARLANDENTLARDVIPLVSAFMKRVDLLGVDCDVTVLEAIVTEQRSRTDAGALNPDSSITGHPLDVQSVECYGSTIPHPKDDFGQIRLIFDPGVRCYQFTSSRAPEDPIWSRVVLHAEDISSVHYSDCDFHVDTGYGDEVNIQMSSSTAATAFVCSLRQTTFEASKYDPQGKPPAKITRVTAVNLAKHREQWQEDRDEEHSRMQEEFEDVAQEESPHDDSLTAKDT